MQSSLMLKLVCKDIERICRGFIWGYNEDRNKIHLVKQDSICWPKIEGGLGLRRMHNMNKAFTRLGHNS